MLFDYIKYLLLGVSRQIHGCLLTEAQCVKPTAKQIRLMAHRLGLAQIFCMNLFKLLVSTSMPFYPQQEVSCVVVGHFCVPLKVMVKGRWLCSDKMLSLQH